MVFLSNGILGQDRHREPVFVNTFPGIFFCTLDEEYKKDMAIFTKLTKQFRYMGDGCPAGDTLRMVVMADEKWIALLLWGSACYRLKHRDDWIGWSVWTVRPS